MVPKLRFPEFLGAGGWDADDLGLVADFVNEKIALEQVALENYVSTENILADYGGIGKASKLPTTGSVTRFQLNDTLVSNIRPYLKKVWIADKEGGASNDVIVIRAKQRLLPQYLSALLKNDAFIDYVMTGAKGVKMPRGDVGSMKAYQALYPPKPEQQKVADCLSSLNELITAQARKVNALKAHKKGLMRQLFPREGETQPRLRFPEFRDAREWVSCTVAELITADYLFPPKDGNHGNIHPKASDYVASGIPFIMASDLKSGQIDTLNCHFISKEQADKLQKGFAKQGDVLLSHKGTVGAVAVVSKITTPYLMLTPQVTYYRVKDKSKLSNKFLAQFFLSDAFQEFLLNASGGGTRSYIGITEQAKLPVKLPKELNEQQRIADSLTSLDDLITAAAQELETLKTHKKGLMQQLFPSMEEAV